MGREGKGRSKRKASKGKGKEGGPAAEPAGGAAHAREGPDTAGGAGKAGAVRRDAGAASSGGRARHSKPRSQKGEIERKKEGSAGDAAPKHMRFAEDGTATASAAKGSSRRAGPQLLVWSEEGLPWFEMAKDDQDAGSGEPADAEALERFQKRGAQLLVQDTAAYEAHKAARGSGDDRWMRQVLSSGTQSDKVAAMTLLVQESPPHALRTLDSLLSMAALPGRREAQMAIDALRDLFVSNLLPADRRLRSFAQQPLGKTPTDAQLALHAFEDELKARYATFVRTLETQAFATLPYFKSMVLRVATQLLMERPEQEAALLSLIVNKLGDPERKVASKTSFLLHELLERHPAMKMVVLDETWRFLRRSNLPIKAQYYAVVFLNQIALRRGDVDVAAADKMLSIYFSLFERAVKNGEVERRLMSALLSGVNRAFPYATTGSTDIEGHMDTLFRVVHTASFSTAVQSLSLLFQAQSARANVTDRFYRAMYAVMLSDGLVSSSRHTVFLNLVYRAMKADVSAPRIRAFAKRLLQIATHMPPGFAAGCVFVVSEVLRSHHELASFITTGERAARGGAGAADDGDDELESFKDAPASGTTPSKVNGDGDGDSDNSGEGTGGGADAGGAEESVELDAERERSRALLASLLGKKGSATPEKASSDGGDKAGDAEESRRYDPAAREPLHCGADTVPLWELLPLASHFHPSVRKFAESLLSQPVGGVGYAGDPLKDFSTMAFLDRFVYRNPKQKDLQAARAPKPGEGDEDAELAVGYAIVQGKSLPGARRSRMQPRAGKRGRVAAADPVNSEEFLALDESQVQPDDMFFYRFFKEKRRADLTAGRARDGDRHKKSEEDEDAEEEKFAQQLAEGLMEDGDPDGDDDEPLDGYGSVDSSDGDDDGAAAGAPFDSDSDDADLQLGDSDDDGDGEQGESSADEDADADAGASRAKRRKRDGFATFADAEEFAEMLESAAAARENPKQRAWEEKRSGGGGRGGRRPRRGGGQSRGGSRGGKRRGGRGGSRR